MNDVKSNLVLACYDTCSDKRQEFNVTFSDDKITIVAVDDHLKHADGSIQMAQEPRSITIELGEDGAIGILLYATDKDDPCHLKMHCDGSIEEIKP